MNYEYQCRNCGLKFETRQPIGARDLATCPECGCVAEKLLSTFNFTFGFKLADECHHTKGMRDYFVRNI